MPSPLNKEKVMGEIVEFRDPAIDRMDEVLKKHWGAFSSEHYRYTEVQGSNTKPPIITIYEWGISVQ